MTKTVEAPGRRTPPGYDDVLEVLRSGLSGRDTTSLGDLVEAFGARGYGPILMLLSLIVISPLGLLPLVPSSIGVLLIMVGIGMVVGTGGIRLPARIAERQVETAKVLGGIGTIEKLTGWLRYVLKVRLRWIASGRIGVTVAGVVVILDGVAMVILGILPLPGVPFILALPVLFLGLGMSARDGLVVGLAIAGAVLSGSIALDTASRVGSIWS